METEAKIDFKLSGTAGTRLLSFDLPPGTYRVGRVPEADLYIPDKTLSRSHAEIEVPPSGNRCFITDLGSKNGTMVNGVRVEARHELHAGDIIMFGSSEFVLNSDAKPSTPTTSVRTIISNERPSASVFMPIGEALKPLPAKVSGLPEFVGAVSEMARMLILSDPQDVMLEKSLKLVSKVVPADRLLIIFVEGEKVEVAASLLADKWSQQQLTLSRSIVHEIMTNKNSVLISDPQSDSRFGSQQSIIMSSLTSAIAVPLFDEGKVLGILYADTRKTEQRYNDNLVRVMATFGNIIAARLANYQLLRERETKREMEAELANAATIQKSLLVSCPPEVPGYALCTFQEQTKSVGGDLYDVRLMRDGRLFFVVADVSGKGMGAALLMSNILASFRVLYEDDGFRLSSAVKMVSSQLCSYSAPGIFATAFCGMLTPETGELTYVGAGHNPPLLSRADGRIEMLESTGLMIGAFDFATWEERNCVLSPGDSLIIYSDGVTEAQNKDFDEYGDERFQTLVTQRRESPPAELVAAVRDDIRAFTGDAPAFDDVTLFVLKRQT